MSFQRLNFAEILLILQMKKQVYRTPFRDFLEARVFAQSLKLSGARGWRLWTKSGNKPSDIPVNPDVFYKDKGWISWGDWLGTGSIRQEKMVCREFKKAREYVQTLNLSGRGAWLEWVKSGNKPNDIPYNPDKRYENQGWSGWQDWLGFSNDKIIRSKWRLFSEARNYIHTLNLKTSKEWFEWCKSGDKPNDIPSAPHKVYENAGWISFGDWLGTGNNKPRGEGWRQFSDARKFVHELKLNNSDEWNEWTKLRSRPEDIPTAPAQVYRDEWLGMGDWLGTNRVRNSDRSFRPFLEARAYVHSLKLSGNKAWEKWAKSSDRPMDIPSNPSRSYKGKGWIDWGDWLCTNTISNKAKIFLPFEDARNYARSLNMSGKEEWCKWAKSDAKPANIPTSPNEHYKNKGWIGWGDWLSKFSRWNKHSILSFVRSIEPELSRLEPKELHSIMLANGMVSASQDSNRKYAIFAQISARNRFFSRS